MKVKPYYGLVKNIKSNRYELLSYARTNNNTVIDTDYLNWLSELEVGHPGKYQPVKGAFGYITVTYPYESTPADVRIGSVVVAKVYKTHQLGCRAILSSDDRNDGVIMIAPNYSIDVPALDVELLFNEVMSHEKDFFIIYK